MRLRSHDQLTDSRCICDVLWRTRLRCFHACWFVGLDRARIHRDILPKLEFCGVPHDVASINCQHVHCWLTAVLWMTVWNLVIFIDCDLSMRTHVTRTVSRCFSTLRQLRQIQRSLPAATFQTLVVALVHFRLDYTAMQCWLVFLPIYIAVFSPCSTQRLVWYIVSDSVWPYHQRSYLPPLVARSAAYRVQAGCIDLHMCIQP